MIRFIPRETRYREVLSRKRLLGLMAHLQLEEARKDQGNQGAARKQV